MSTKFRVTDEDAQRALVVGKTGSGKTTLAVLLAEEATRCVGIDVEGSNDPDRLGHETWTVGPLQRTARGASTAMLVAFLDAAS